MRFERLLEICGDLAIVDSATLRTLGEDPKVLSVQLTRWVNEKKLLQLRRGVYVLPKHFRRRNVPLEYLANLAHSPSYVSLERALSIYELIPEKVPLVRSITTSRPLVLQTPLGEFDYRHVKQSWFFGYQEISIGDFKPFVATPEKALLDLVYHSRGDFPVERIEQLRLQNLDRINTKIIMRMAKKEKRPRMVRSVKQICDYIVAKQKKEVTL